jgi:hypothetical protein
MQEYWDLWCAKQVQKLLLYVHLERNLDHISAVNVINPNASIFTACSKHAFDKRTPPQSKNLVWVLYMSQKDKLV